MVQSTGSVLGNDTDDVWTWAINAWYFPELRGVIGIATCRRQYRRHDSDNQQLSHAHHLLSLALMRPSHTSDQIDNHLAGVHQSSQSQVNNVRVPSELNSIIQLCYQKVYFSMFFGVNCRLSELIQYRWSVGVPRPSPLNTWPKWLPQVAQVTSVRLMPCESSSVSTTVPGMAS